MTSDPAASTPTPAAPQPAPRMEKGPPEAALPCTRCLNIRWFLMSAAPLLAMGLVDPVLTDRLLSRLPDLRQLVLWFPLVIAGTFAWRLFSWRRQQDR